jgi:hypothetical protein
MARLDELESNPIWAVVALRARAKGVTYSWLSPSEAALAEPSSMPYLRLFLTLSDPGGKSDSVISPAHYS